MLQDMSNADHSTPKSYATQAVHFEEFRLSLMYMSSETLLNILLAYVAI